MPRAGKKRTYYVRAEVLREDHSPYTVLFTQKAYRVHDAWRLAHDRLKRDGVYVGHMDLFYDRFPTRAEQIDHLRQEHVRRHQGTLVLQVSH